ncbi:hypothetical protein FIBSPDRAFT_805770 [Athelia psychrophila]|uniref:Uncharacterized protein n=1 Tax=Athelia psychrophila TaxID=1759441 RepID=A0A167VU24_9AGAM|nr:hypothetical protein FIBSPDRAFT_805770 [Fibularhizoctonia sp. CBS 109695]
MGLASLIPQAWRPKRKSDSSPTIQTSYSPRSGPIHLEPSQSRNSFPPSSTSSRSGSLRGSPERFRRDSYLGRVQEEADADADEPVDPTDDEGGPDNDDDMDWELAQIGMYRGSYTRLIATYTVVPLASAALLLLIALTLRLIYPRPAPSGPYPDPTPPPFPNPSSELLLATALWSLAHTLHVPIYTLFAALAPTDTAALLATVAHCLVANLLRLSALAILRVRHDMEWPAPTWRDPAFARVVWLAVGWAGAEAVVGVWQGYETIMLYRDVLVPAGREAELLDAVAIAGEGEGRGGSPVMVGSGFLEATDFVATMGTGIDEQVDRDLDRLLGVKAREEVEEVYGMPAIRIPVFVSTLQRLNAILLALGLGLLLAAAYLSSTLSMPLPEAYEGRMSNLPIALAFPLLTLLHIMLSVLHTPRILSRIGLHTAAYIGFIVGLGSVFAGLAAWGALS